MKLKDRSETIWHLSMSYSALVESGAPSDVLAGVTYWLRCACREGMTEADLEHALESVTDGKVQPMARKPPQ